MRCAPPVGGGFDIENVTGVAKDGFTEAFYMQNFCWEKMTHVAVKNFDYFGQELQIKDEEQETTDLSYLKVIKIYSYNKKITNLILYTKSETKFCSFFLTL